MSEIAQFKLYVQHEFERRINLMPDLGFREPDQLDKPIKIAQISFANENSKIIEWLIERGDAIKFDKFDKV